MIRNLLLFFSLFFTLNVSAHPLHISVTNIDIEKNHIKIAIKLFQDDFTETLKHKYKNNEISLSDSNTNWDKFINQYISENLTISIGENRVSLNMQKKTVEELSVWVYYKIPIKEQPEKLTIKNQILTDWFPDQKNLVIINTLKDEKGLTFDNNNTEQVVNL